MLKLFEVSGFKSFKDKVTIDFSDVRDYRFNTQCITNGLVSKAIIYGKNSVGKSNFALAMSDIKFHLSSGNYAPGLYEYYLNVASLNNYAEFHYVFQFDSDEVDYIYRKDNNQSLIYEKVILNGKLLYEYDYNTKRGDTSGIKNISPTLNLDYLDSECILKYILSNSVIDDDHPLRHMVRFVKNMLSFRSYDANRYVGTRHGNVGYFDFILEESALREFEEFLHTAGVEDNLTVKTDADGIKRLYFDTETPLPFFKVASSGTKALYTFFYWYKTAQDVSVLFIDEFDAFYHYELAEGIVAILERMTETQVILTSHNTNLLTNRIMRPDCYFILTKDKLTSFANATSRELREGHNLEKLFMSGEFNG